MQFSSRGEAVIATQAIFLGLAWIFVSLRIYVRRIMVKKLDFDDYLLLFTLAAYTCFAGFSFKVASITVFNRGIALSLPLSVSLPDMETGSFYYYLAELFYIISSAALRTAVALLLLRIAHSKPQRVVVCIVIALMLIYSICFLFIVIFQCSPVSFFWNWHPGAPGRCNNHHILANTGYAHMALSFVADWTLGLMPIWLLWKVQISRQRKIAISVLLGFGLICGLAAIARAYPIDLLLDTKDFWADWAPLVICSTVEVGLGLIAASLAAMRPLFTSKRLRSLSSGWSSRGLFGRSHRTGNSESNSSRVETGIIKKETVVHQESTPSPTVPKSEHCVPERRGFTERK